MLLVYHAMSLFSTCRTRALPSAPEELGIRSVPAVVIDGALADCCAGRGPDMTTLRRAGLDQPLA